MGKFLKITSITLGLILLFVFLLMSILVTFVSPNRFKPIIAAQMYDNTGRKLTIDGDLSWSIFPYLGIKVGHMTLSNSPDFKEKIFAEITHATVGIKLLPLLKKKIESNGIELAGVTVNLIKNSEGKANWDFISQGSSDNSNTPNTIPTEKNKTILVPSDDNKKMLISLTIPSVDITDAHITWQNDVTKQHADIDKFELHAKNINLDQAFPVSSAFNFVAQNPNLSGEATLDADVKIALDKQLYNARNIYFVIKTRQGTKKITLALSGEIAVDVTQETLNISNLVGHFSNLSVKGKVNVVKIKTNPQVTGHLESSPFDLKELLQNIGQDAPALSVAKNVVFNMDFALATDSANQKAALQSVSMHANLKIEELIAANLKLNKVTSVATLKNGLLEISPMSALLYAGTLQSTIKIDFNSTTPQITSHVTLANVQAEPLLKDMQGSDSKLKVKGAGDIDLQVTTIGFAGNSLVQNLNGNAQFSFKNGVVEGVNIGYLVTSAFALARHEALPVQGGENTEFGNLTATTVIHNGVFSNNDLLLDSPKFVTKGQGTVDLVNQKIDFKLQTTSKEAAQDKGKNILNIYNLTIPIQIIGSLKSPSIRIDSEDILKQVAQQQIQHVEDKVKVKMNDQLKNVIKDKLPGKAGEMLQNFLGR